jgi:hypothetical protein
MNLSNLDDKSTMLEMSGTDYPVPNYMAVKTS